jgi:hypothetical protein
LRLENTNWNDKFVLTLFGQVSDIYAKLDNGCHSQKYFTSTLCGLIKYDILNYYIVLNLRYKTVHNQLESIYTVV